MQTFTKLAGRRFLEALLAALIMAGGGALLADRTGVDLVQFTAAIFLVMFVAVFASRPAAPGLALVAEALAAAAVVATATVVLAASVKLDSVTVPTVAGLLMFAVALFGKRGRAAITRRRRG